MAIHKFCLLVNDDPYDQAVFVNALMDVSPGTLCFTAPDGIVAMHMMLKEDIVPDFIFVELSMPKLNGLDFLREIKKINYLKDIPVFVHASLHERNKLSEIKEAGAKAIYLQRYNHGGICNLIHLYLSDNVLFVHPN
jgi:chemotaxis response regulator CheB